LLIVDDNDQRAWSHPVKEHVLGDGALLRYIRTPLTDFPSLSKSMFLEMGLSCSPLSISSVAAFDFLPSSPQRLSYITSLDGSLSTRSSNPLRREKVALSGSQKILK